MTEHACDVCIVGAGSAGLSVAAGCAQLGLRIVLIERGAMGGECLNSGCIPSKALLAAAKRAHAVTAALGVSAPIVDFAAVQDGVRAIIETIAPHDSAERFTAMGATVLRGSARFEDDRTILVGADRVRARWFVLATGARAAIPDIPGLDPGAVLTNETIFTLRERPDHLLILGGGPLGIEMALAHRRLGVKVTVIERAGILPRDEPELVEILRRSLEREGVVLIEGANVQRFEHAGAALRVTLSQRHDRRSLTFSHCLVATGRVPTIEGLDLAAAGIAATPDGIRVDARLRTSRRHVFALGDCIDGPRFTHAASAQAGVVVRNLAFRWPARIDYRALPWVTYSDPELAHVGLTEAQARMRHGRRVAVYAVPLARNDRAIADGTPEGLVKVVVGAGGRILGASILAPGAGELIGLWCLAITRKLDLKAIADLILPYPTLSETAKAIASAHYAPRLFGETTRRIVRAIGRLPRW